MLRITKIYFPSVTVIKMVDERLEPRYFTSTQPGEIFPVEGMEIDEATWLEAIEEAKSKGAKITTIEV